MTSNSDKNVYQKCADDIEERLEQLEEKYGKDRVPLGLIIDWMIERCEEDESGKLIGAYVKAGFNIYGMYALCRCDGDEEKLAKKVGMDSGKEIIEHMTGNTQE